eukprot:TRINITY_DN1011_c0_g2_i2.p1 TRINITY_DN1011_c0_g2~~TRINITY_DN1011_c0_g2_i2.p1  ORF type:complete len:72 (-),score=3.17 TRINITY_DN1011_c0_g2_i2:386-601(-)
MSIKKILEKNQEKFKKNSKKFKKIQEIISNQKCTPFFVLFFDFSLLFVLHFSSQNTHIRRQPASFFFFVER